MSASGPSGSLVYKCEDLVPSLHMCEDLVPVLHLCENLVPILHIVLVLHTLKTIKNMKFEHTFYTTKIIAIDRK